MEFLDLIVIVFGLSLFEIIASIDNAIINAEVLRTMGARARRWFLGSIMVVEGFGYHAPVWLSPSITALVVVYFFLKSKRALMVPLG